MLGFLMATAILFTWAFFGARMLIRQDDVDPDELARCREELRLNAQQEFMKDVRGNVLAYLRRDFHPSHIEDIDLAHGRLAEVGIEVVPAA
jgi:predicted metal-dependent hydrolase